MDKEKISNIFIIIGILVFILIVFRISVYESILEISIGGSSGVNIIATNIKDTTVIILFSIASLTILIGLYIKLKYRKYKRTK